MESGKLESGKLESDKLESDKLESDKLENLCVYEIIPNTKNIISSLIDNINNNNTFRKKISKLESAGSKEKNQATMLRHTLSNIRVFGSKINPLFLAKDIGILLGISHIKILIKKFEKEEKIFGYITNNNKTKRVIFLTKLGIYRCFFASRSPLAKLFRKFIVNIVDNICTNESEILKKISEKFQIDNPELIEQGMCDLYNKIRDYETQLINEREKCEAEKKIRKEAEDERLEVDIVNSFNMMHIEQLKKEKDGMINKIKCMKNSLIDDNDDNSIDLVEVRMIKEKYMKPLYIYILYPDYFTKLLQTYKKELQKEFTECSVKNNCSEINSDLEDDDSTDAGFDCNILINQNITKKDNIRNKKINVATYKQNFDHIFSDPIQGIQIENDEILYYLLGFAKIPKQIILKKKIVCVSTKWVANKQHFANTLNSLNDTCDKLILGKYTLYKTSIEEIGDVIREEFINL
jgi:prophage antirepressor-like protein